MHYHKYKQDFFHFLSLQDLVLQEKLIYVIKKSCQGSAGDAVDLVERVLHMMMKLRPPFLFFVFFLAFSIFLNSIPVHSHPREPFKSILDQGNLGSWKNGLLSETSAESAQAPGPSNDGPMDTLVLAGNRTKRPDILSSFQKYSGGWDIANKHYWASVGYTGAAGFILAILWLFLFGLALLVYHCCGWRIDMKGQKSRYPQKVCLIALIIFTCAAVIGCILLSVGQDEFHDEALHTLDYVVNQSDYTVQTLRNVTEYMAVAKTVNVAQVFLPSDVMDDIDRLNLQLNSAADTLKEKTNENSRKIETVFNIVRSSLISVAVVMLVISLLGLVVSILGHQHMILLFVISGWLLVAVTFVLCGVFVILNNAIADTCLAMEEWAENPHAATALSNILPCVDQTATNQTLYKSKQVVNDIVNIVNAFTDSYANSNPPPQAVPYYYNQSGPTLPHLCYPYDSQLQERNCTDQEVSTANASVVWLNYTCIPSPSGLCSSVGRLTPDMYTQMVAAVNISYALQHYTPLLLNLQNCNFVRDTFTNITANRCPHLEHNLRIVNAGLAMISVGVMLSLALWMLYANRPQREEVFAKLSLRIKGGCYDKRSCATNGDLSSRGTTPGTGV